MSWRDSQREDLFVFAQWHKPVNSDLDMSEDPKPPPLHLKPRLRPAEPAPADPSPPAEDAPPADELASEPDAQRLRLKPRLKVEPEPAAQSAAEEAPAEESPAAEEAEIKKFTLKPKLKPAPAEKAEDPPPAAAPPSRDAPPADAEGDDAPKFKLKAKAPTAPSPSSLSTETSPPAEVASATDGKAKGAMPPPSLVAAADEAPDDGNTPAPPPLGKIIRKRQGRSRGLIFGVVGLLVLGVVGYFAWSMFMTPDLPPPPLVRKAVVPPPAVPEPEVVALSEAAAQPVSLPKQLIDRAEEVVAANEAGDDANIDKVLAADEEVAGPLGRVTAQSQSEIAPGITATTTTVMSATEAGPGFRAFVAEARINGVFQGSPARALINGHTYREGEMVEPSLGIVFDHIEADEKLIIFRDQSGATVQRKY